MAAAELTKRIAEVSPRFRARMAGLWPPFEVTQ